jgi:uncharacterized protein
MGSAPIPLSQFVVKVHSRCDLACDHCYVYEAADQSWHGRPMVLSSKVAAQAARRIAEHTRAHGLKTVQVVLHGGEPLLAGRSRLEQIITALRAATHGVCHLDMRIHTNGVLLSEAFCELFAKHRVKVGISVDGDRAANDRHRRYANGRSSYDQVIAAIGLLRTPAFRDLYSGLLCTIDITNDPVVVYDSLVALEPPRIDFLLPHATWDAPPARTMPGGTDYADWLIAIYDRWAAHGRPVQIRTFDSILSTLAGGPSFTEALGLEPVTLTVIETDGSYEQADSLKAAFDGAPGTGTNVFDHDLDTVARHPGIQARQQGIAGLCSTCQQCPVVTSCGGGLYAHRYKAGSFDNPSVYCADLTQLITHIGSNQPTVTAGLPGIPVHALARADLAALAAGTGGAAVMTQLAGAQQSLLRAVLGSLYQAATADTQAAPATVDLHDAWALLTTLDQTQPQALGAALRHPYVRAWAAHCLGVLRPSLAWPRRGPRHGLAADLGHLAAIAAAAAVRARVPATVTVPIVDHAVHLPTLGRLSLGASQDSPRVERDPKSATIDVRGDTVTIQAGPVNCMLAIADLLGGEPGTSAGHGAWQPVRMLRAPGLCVVLEDTDPYRDCNQWPAAPRLDDAEIARWQALFQEAWLEIARDHGAYGAGIASGLISLVPLTSAQDGRDISAVSRHAPGAVGVARPAGPSALALLLISGFQQAKLSALLDLYDLYDSADNRLFTSPWGDEGKQHLEDLFRDAYAHMAGSEFWRTRQHRATGAAAEAARKHFVQWRADTAEAIETLVDSGSLTPLGTSFVSEMRQAASR